jgi:DNA repair protein RadA/Sms
VGEVGLSGEIRTVNQLDRRLNEVSRLGFKRCIIPKTGVNINPPKDLEIIGVSTLREAVNRGLVEGKGGEKEEDS